MEKAEEPGSAPCSKHRGLGGLGGVGGREWGWGVVRASGTDTSDITDEIAQTRVPVLRSEISLLPAPSLGAGRWRPGHLLICWLQRGLAKQVVATFSFHNGRQDPP